MTINYETPRPKDNIAPAVLKQGEVRSALELIHESISVLSKSIQELNGQQRPVMRDEDASRPDIPSGAGNTPVSIELAAINNEIRRAIMEINAMAGRLEL